jgi:small subunit ribosomal protein S8
MPVTDPIADLLTRIRNAIGAKKRVVECPRSTTNVRIVDVLAREHFIRGYRVLDNDVQGTIRIALSYDSQGTSAITGIQRVSRPGLRHYCGAGKLPRVRNNLGIAVISTPMGVITNREAKKNNVGGEVLCQVW